MNNFDRVKGLYCIILSLQQFAWSQATAREGRIDRGERVGERGKMGVQWALVVHGVVTLLVVVSFLCGHWPIFQGTFVQKIHYFLTFGAYDYFLWASLRPQSWSFLSLFASFSSVFYSCLSLSWIDGQNRFSLFLIWGVRECGWRFRSCIIYLNCLVRKGKFW